MINLVILDIDGVMTDGTKVYDESHNVIYKKYCDRDFTAIKRLKDCGVSVCFLSGDKRINEISCLIRRNSRNRSGAGAGGGVGRGLSLESSGEFFPENGVQPHVAPFALGEGRFPEFTLLAHTKLFGEAG